MKLLVAIISVLCVSVALLAAQAEEKAPFEGEHTKALTLQELAKIVSDDSGQTITIGEDVDGRVDLIAHTNAEGIQGDTLFTLLQDALRIYRYVLVPSKDGWQCVPATEAVSHAPNMTRAEIDGAPDWQWAKTRVDVPAGNAKELAGVCEALGTRQGGKATSDGDNVLELCDRVDRLREMLKLITTVEVHDEPAEREYRAPAGLTDQDIMSALNEAFQLKAGLHVRAEVTGDGFTVRVTGNSRVQKLAAQIIESLSE